MPVTVDIVLPCYNPNDAWINELLDFNTFIKEKYLVNYILVNDGSPGNKISKQVAELNKKNISIQLISYEKNKGKGYALRQGVAQSKSNFTIYTDIDFPFTNDSTLILMNALVQNDKDIVAGYRDQLYYQKKMSGFRKILSKAFRFFIKDILKMSVSDTQCGLKGFNENGRAKFLATKINRYLFDFEFIFISSKDKTIRIAAIPVQLKDNVVFSKMKIKILLQEMFNLMNILVFRKA